MRAVGCHHGLAKPHHAASQLQRHKVYAYYHHAAVLRLCTLQVVETFDVKPFTHATVRPEPGHAGFKQCHAKRTKVFFDQSVPFCLWQIREAQFEVFTGNRFTTF
ncbi:hypothetical protein D3C81_1411370 [compost metagenome]